MTDPRKTAEDLRRIADELERKLRLAGQDARARWQALQPRLARLEQTVKRTGEQAGKAVTRELTSLGKALRELRDQVRR